MNTRYQILEKLGEGGSGCVFKAYDTTMDRSVAIKRLLADSDAVRTTDVPTALRTEAALMAKVRHPSVITAYDVAEDSEGLFIVMELLGGHELTKWINTSEMSWSDFSSLVTQTLSALAAMHEKGVLHLDLTPENIRVQRQEDGTLRATLIDFGLAQHAPQPVKQRLSPDGRLFGSVRYMAPEQFHLSQVDARTDLYSIGCVFYRCLTGKSPFSGSTAEAIRDAHLSHELRPLHELRPDMPKVVCDWVHWMIRMEISDRPASAKDALAAFHAMQYSFLSGAEAE
jgi:serine/threonine protein kinase